MAVDDGQHFDGEKSFIDNKALIDIKDRATRGAIPSLLSTEVHLIRHGEVEGAQERRVRGQIDVPLSREGESQHTRLVSWFAENQKPVELVFSSDLSRCEALGHSFAKRFDVLHASDSMLREQSMGEWEGRTWESLQDEHTAAITAYWSDYYLSRPDGGETLQEMEARIQRWWAQALERHAGRRILIVTHAGVIRLLLCHWLNIHPRESLRFSPGFATHTWVSIAEAGAVIHCLGERPWTSNTATPGEGPTKKDPAK